MTPEQLAEIEQRWASNEVTMQTINDFNLLLAEVRKLQEKLHYEETCHAEAQEEVRRLNRINENGWGPDALRKHLREAAGND